MAKATATHTWDPVLIISQIVSMQTLHYLTLAIIMPPILAMFADRSSLEFEGGAANVGMVMDWRLMAGWPTVPSKPGEDPWRALRIVWSGGKKVASDSSYWDGRIDPVRGWIIAGCWIAASAADVYYLYTLIRRPRMVLDFSLTLLFNHLVLTSYYAGALPTSWFFWAVMIASMGLMVVAAEQLCVKREMSEGLAVVTSNEADEMEMGDLLRRD